MSQRLPRISPNKLLKILTSSRAGYLIAKRDSEGSHVHLKHLKDPKIFVTIAIHAGDLKHGMLLGILKQAKLSREEFLRLL